MILAHVLSFISLAVSPSIEEASPRDHMTHYEAIEDKTSLPILTPSLKERRTLKIRMANGLEAYLISDPRCNQSAAALSIEVGSWCDPKEFPGMAHFLEHMLFLGTHAYPQEDAFMQHIGDHGGTVNAATYPDHTTFMFSVQFSESKTRKTSIPRAALSLTKARTTLSG